MFEVSLLSCVMYLRKVRPPMYGNGISNCAKCWSKCWHFYAVGTWKKMLAYLLLANMSYYLILINIFHAAIKWFLYYDIKSAYGFCLCYQNVWYILCLFTVMAFNLNLLRPLLCHSLVRHARPPLTVTSWVGLRPPTCPDASLHPAPACIRLYATKKAKGQ